MTDTVPDLLSDLSYVVVRGTAGLDDMHAGIPSKFDDDLL
jgi:hypothetical protein